MKVSNILIEKLKEFEGFSAKAYRADKSEKYLTIGYGHYGKDVKSGMTVTREQATELLRKDLGTAENYVGRLGVCKNQGQFDALVDFVYNLGCGSLASSTLLKRIKAGAGETEVRTQFAKWVYCGGRKLQGLVRRRAWEADRYFEK